MEYKELFSEAFTLKKNDFNSKEYPLYFSTAGNGEFPFPDKRPSPILSNCSGLV